MVHPKLRRRLRRVSLAALALALGVLVSTLACRRQAEPRGAGPLLDAAKHARVVAPRHHLSSITIAAPDAFWAQIQRGIGGVLGLLPSEAAPVAFAALDLDLELAREVDGREPIVIALGLEGTSPTFVAACVVKDGAKVLRAFADPGAPGAASPFTPIRMRDRPGRSAHGGDAMASAKYDRDSGAENASAESVVVAAGPRGELLVASSRVALDTLGEFAAFTLLPEAREVTAPPALVADVPEGALANVVVPSATELWARSSSELRGLAEAAQREHGGKEADFGDPSQILDVLDAFVRERIQALSSIRRVRFALRVGEGATGLVAAVRAVDDRGSAGDGSAGIEPATDAGDPAFDEALSHTPDDALMGWLGTDREEGSGETGDGGARGGPVRRLLASRVRDSDGEHVRRALAEWNDARAPRFGVAAALDDGARFDLWAEVRDGGAVPDASTRELARRERFKRPVALTTRTDDGWIRVRVGRRALSAKTDAGSPNPLRLAPFVAPFVALIGGPPDALLFFDASRLRAPPFDALSPSATVFLGTRDTVVSHDAVLSVPFPFLRAAVEASSAP